MSEIDQIVSQFSGDDRLRAEQLLTAIMLRERFQDTPFPVIRELANKLQQGKELLTEEPTLECLNQLRDHSVKSPFSSDDHRKIFRARMDAITASKANTETPKTGILPIISDKTEAIKPTKIGTF